MGKVEFDLIKLKQLCDINVRDTVKNFSGYEEYFLKLNEFVKESKYYLSEYTADMIVSSENERDNFRADLKTIRAYLISLGITLPVQTLIKLDYGADRGDSEALSNWVNRFHDEISRIAESVASSQIITEEAAKAGSNMEKPLILAADDKPELLTAVVYMLEDRFRVMAATSGKAALKLIEKHPPKLFLLDIEMPQMDGYELAEAIRKQERFAETPIIFLTSKNTREDVISAVRRGGNDYLVKPVKKDLLLVKILNHLGSI